MTKRPDMDLVEDRFVPVSEVDALLKSLDPSTPCALVIVGHSARTDELAARWLARRKYLVVMLIESIGDVVRIGFRDLHPESLLPTLSELVEHVGGQERERFTRIQLRAVRPSEDSPEPEQVNGEHPLLDASMDWLRALLKNAAKKIPFENGDLHGLAVSRGTLMKSLDASCEPAGQKPSYEPPLEGAALDRALANVATNPEPLAVAAHLFKLDPLEFRMMLLTLAPELDNCFQLCIGALLDDISRRVGTMSLYCSLLGVPPNVRGKRFNGGALTRSLVFEGYAGRPAAADEPLRPDPFLAEWLLDKRDALEDDPRVRRILRLMPWPGASLLKEEEERAAGLIEKIRIPTAARWIVFDGDDPAAWRAILERGALGKRIKLIRVEAARLASVEMSEVEDCAIRIGRCAKLTRKPLIIDITNTDSTEAEPAGLGLFLKTLSRTRCRAAVICRNEALVVQLLGGDAYELVSEPPLPMSARVQAVRAAALGADAYLTREAAEAIANRYPLHIDGLEHAMRLAASRPKNYDADDPALDRLTVALKELASEAISHLVERIEPVFSLEEVVLPPDRKQQLIEIVDHVRLAPQVLDEWKFREKLPYGRGVAALFSGASGTGKTMAAMGIARSLNIQILRLDLSRVVSKYIGETEKNIDRVFTDAQASGAAILIDEADALLGKRSEVKDSHDRYANIEVAYLLQRMEAYEGLVMLTTNMRRNLDAAFLRRLRFIVEFPRPDVTAREKIWRQCLPAEAHELTDGEFRQLARRLELTGGQIRQITLRAAFIAAAAGKQIALEHIAKAATAELTKLGMPPVEIALLEARRAA
ncbi:MAG TPA: ATP-binding protein [Pyrinomonadaceae bacterium]|nr:ATP-binding protein [Pyrinomonadaceae bacterium]